MLDIVHTREVYVDEIGKSGHRVRQASVGEQLEQVAHTVATIERHPVKIHIEDDISSSAKRRPTFPKPRNAMRSGAHMPDDVPLRAG